MAAHNSSPKAVLAPAPAAAAAAAPADPTPSVAGPGAAAAAAGAGAAAAGAAVDTKTMEQIVTPWTVKGSGGKDFNYKQLTETFGLEAIDEALLARWERVTGAPLHPWLRRQIFYAHKGLPDVLDAVEQKRPVYLYTGRGPSNDMHIGHSLSFLFTKYLQDALKCWVVIQLSDEEKYYFKPDLTRTAIDSYLAENARDIIAFGFDPNKTFIFSNFRYGGHMHDLSADLMRIVNVNQFNNIYGFDTQSLIGQVYWPVQQIVPAFSGAFPHIFKADQKAVCLVPMGVDQAVYFRCARDYAARLGFPKPAMICAKFLPGLGGDGDKMSSTGSGADKSLYLNSTEKTVRDKITKFAFSGGRVTMAEHRKLGGDVTVDVSYKYLTFFEPDDAVLASIGTRFSTGAMSSAEIKKEMANRVWAFLAEHQKKRAAVTDAVLKKFMPTPRCVIDATP